MKHARWLPLALGCWVGLQAMALTPDEGVDQALERLGLEDVVYALQPIVDAQLGRAGERTDPGQARAIRQALSAPRLRSALDRELRVTFDAALYGRALDALGDPAFDRLLNSCHGSGRRDFRTELETYRARLEESPPLDSRVYLARQLDAAARTSRIAALAQGQVERLILDITHPETRAANGIPWHRVESERLAALQNSAQTWYLFCARFSPESLLERLVERYSTDEVQQVLEHYEAALAVVMDKTAQRLPQ